MQLYLQAYYKHTALNLGQAFRDLRYLHKYPKTKSQNYSYIISILKRTKSFIQNLYYAVLHPLWTHHTKEDCQDLNSKSTKQWFLIGYKPWIYDTKK